MKINLTKSYLEKLSKLSVKFHNDEANLADLVQLRLLISAFQAYLKNNTASPDVAFQFSEIRKLSQQK